MSGPSSPPSITQSRGSGPDDEPAAIRLGFCAEPIVDLRCLVAAPIYCECLARMLISESILLKGGDFVPISSTAATSPARRRRAPAGARPLSDDPGAVLGCNISPKRSPMPVPGRDYTADRAPPLAGEAPRPGGDRERAARRDRRRGGAAGTSQAGGMPSGH